MTRTLALALGMALGGAPGLVQGQAGVPCWYVPNGANVTLQCANGFWHTTTPEGEVYTGNGVEDPNASVRGSGIVIDPGTGGITLRGQTVTAPTQVTPTLAPGQAGQYGLPARD